MISLSGDDDCSGDNNDDDGAGHNDNSNIGDDDDDDDDDNEYDGKDKPPLVLCRIRYNCIWLPCPVLDHLASQGLSRLSPVCPEE